jgi:hypothetical protein
MNHGGGEVRVANLQKIGNPADQYYFLQKTLAEPFVILFILGEGMGWQAWLPLKSQCFNNTNNSTA